MMAAMILLALAANVAPDHPAPRMRAPAQHARANLADFISDADYPAGAARRGEQGTVGFEVDVDSAGHVGACRVTASSGSAELDEATCRIMRDRARFTPALDRRGRPIPDHAKQRIHWVLPDRGGSRATANLASYLSDADYPAEAIRNGEEGTTGFELQVGTDGSVTACHILQSSGSRSLDEASCRIMQARARFSPARDQAGNPVPDIVRSRIRWVMPAYETFPAIDGVDLTPLLSAEDYPAEALRRRAHGQVGLQLLVLAEGRVAECRVTASSRSAALDARSCEIVQERALFRPRRDAAGHAILSNIRATISWTLPPP